MWSWELLTQVFEIPAYRLVCSVYDDDDEAYNIWNEVVGVPKDRIFRMGAEDNFWHSGPTGPCGPCSEIYFDFFPEKSHNITLDDDDRYLELYNLVFMQYNRLPDGSLVPLSKKNIDTGMGLERMAQILQRVPNNYETDLIRPVIDKTCLLAKISSYKDCSESTKTSLKVIGDHMRAVVNLIADGVHSSNIGRGYVLRRLIRRIVRHGRQIGIESPFLCQLAQVIFASSERQKRDGIEKELDIEESRFVEVLKIGESQLYKILEKPSKVISGADAFELYDTFGFPLELTEEIARENDRSVDKEGFDLMMKTQKERARASQTFQTEDVNDILTAQKLSVPTSFVGYHEHCIDSSRICMILKRDSLVPVEEANVGDKICVVLDRTPFYAEGGGQLADFGKLFSLSKNTPCEVTIYDVRKKNGAYLHYGEVKSGVLRKNQVMAAKIDWYRRMRLRIHHTGTHLLQAALKECIDSNIAQAGSLVDTDRLRFDFTFSQSLTDNEITKVEDAVNRWIFEGHKLQTTILRYEEAIDKGAIAMFGEKYESNVRVVEVPGVSMELCGGTHVEDTREIGLFKIISESGIASGIRRVEAVAGPALLDWVRKRDIILEKASMQLRSSTDEIPVRIEALQGQLKKLQQEKENIHMQLITLNCRILANKAQKLGDSVYLVSNIETEDAGQLRDATRQLARELGDNALIALISQWKEEGKVSMCIAVGKRIQQKGLRADHIVKKICEMVDGKGGGKADFAQGGGKNVAMVQEAISWIEKTSLEVLANKGIQVA
eukprot:jgi/Galph1/2535/GphlegSOOS_G1214.1